MKLLIMFLFAFMLILGCAGNAGNVDKNGLKNSSNNANNNLSNNNISNVKNETAQAVNDENITKQVAKEGDTVSVDYVGTFDNGTVFDTNLESEAKKAGLVKPKYQQFTFKLGDGSVIVGFEEAIIGMRLNEEKSVHIAAEDAYGEVNPDYVVNMPMEKINGGKGLKIGSVVSSGNGAIGVIKKIENGNVTVDFNHELAGKALNFKIILSGIK